MMVDNGNLSSGLKEEIVPFSALVRLNLELSGTSRGWGSPRTRSSGRAGPGSWSHPTRPSRSRAAWSSPSAGHQPPP